MAGFLLGGISSPFAVEVEEEKSATVWGKTKKFLHSWVKEMEKEFLSTGMDDIHVWAKNKKNKR